MWLLLNESDGGKMLIGCCEEVSSLMLITLKIFYFFVLSEE